MIFNKRGQAAFEYLTTYGWAFLAAIVTVGALSYFGFMNPSTLLPNKCDFGKQLECVESEIISDGTLNIMFRNNFGKSITLTDAQTIIGNYIDDSDPNHPSNNPIIIDVGETKEMALLIDTNVLKGAGSKQEINLIINFERAGGGNPSHNLTGTVFSAVKNP